MTWLLDTMVVSEPSRRRPDPRILEWIAQQPDDELKVSVLTFGELRKGILTARDRASRTRLDRWFVESFAPYFTAVALPITQAIAETWGRFTAEASARGEVLPPIDGLIAATAYEHRLIVVTRNTRHYEMTGIPVLNPWEPT